MTSSFAAVEEADEQLTPFSLSRRERHHATVRRDRRELLEADEVGHNADPMRRDLLRRTEPLSVQEGAQTRRCGQRDGARRDEREASTDAVAATRLGDGRLLRTRFEMERQIAKVLKSLFRLLFKAPPDDASSAASPDRHAATLADLVQDRVERVGLSDPFYGRRLSTFRKHNAETEMSVR